MLLCGGYDGHSARKECFSFCVETSSWSRLSDLPILREEEKEEDEGEKEGGGGKEKGEEEPKRIRWRGEEGAGGGEEEGKKTTTTSKRKEEEEAKRSKRKEEEEKEEEEEERTTWGLSEHQSIAVAATKSLYLIGGLVDTNFLHPQKIVKVDLSRGVEGKGEEGEKEGRGGE